MCQKQCKLWYSELFQTYSMCLRLRHHWCNVKLWLWRWRWHRRQMWTKHNEFVDKVVGQNCLGCHSLSQENSYLRFVFAVVWPAGQEEHENQGPDWFRLVPDRRHHLVLDAGAQGRPGACHRHRAAVTEVTVHQESVHRGRLQDALAEVRGLSLC